MATRLRFVSLASPSAHPSSQVHTQCDAVIRNALQLIDAHEWDRVSFSDLAFVLGVSKSVLSRRFKRTTRMTFRRYLIESRLKYARHLLATSDHSITIIAQLAGFGDLPRFDKVFKAYVGVSPLGYRKQRTRHTTTNY